MKIHVTSSLFVKTGSVCESIPQPFDPPVVSTGHRGSEILQQVCNLQVTSRTCSLVFPPVSLGERKLKGISIWKNLGEMLWVIFLDLSFWGGRFAYHFLMGGDDNHSLKAIWLQNKPKSQLLILPSLPANLVKTFRCFFLRRAGVEFLQSAKRPLKESSRRKPVDF